MAQIPNIDPESTWIVSDTHFGHKNIVGFCDRPEEHEDRIVQRWNEEVPDSATVLHLGDFSYRNNSYTKHVIAPKLKGKRKLLIMGNHDKQRPNFYRECGFKIVRPFEITLYLRKVPYVVSFSHYPLRKPMGSHYIHLHGHIHNNGYGGVKHRFVPFSVGQINVSVEQTHYRPVNLAALLDGFIYGVYEERNDQERN